MVYLTWSPLEACLKVIFFYCSSLEVSINLGNIDSFHCRAKEEFKPISIYELIQPIIFMSVSAISLSLIHKHCKCLSEPTSNVIFPQAQRKRHWTKCTLAANSRQAINCLSTQCQPMIGRQSPARRLTLHWQSNRQSIETWSTVHWQLIDCRSTLDQQSIDPWLLAAKVHLVQDIYLG